MAIPISYNIKNLAVRWNSSLITAVTIGLAIFVLALSFAIVEGLKQARKNAGRAENVLILQQGAKRITDSYISKETFHKIADSTLAKRQNGMKLVAPEIVAMINTPRALQPTDQVFVRLRGVNPKIATQQKDFEIIAGEIFLPGRNQLLVGKTLAKKFPQLSVGKQIKLGKQEWTISGHFTAAGPGYNIEIWGDTEQLLANCRDNYSAVNFTLINPKQLAALERELQDKKIRVVVYTEREYYQRIIDEEMDIFYALGMLIFAVMAIGAFFTTINTVYSLVENRLCEMAVLRTIGFSRFSVYISFIIESCLITLLGGAFGLLLLLPLNDFPVTKWQAVSEISYNISITPGILVVAILVSLALGVIGGFLPAWKASNLKMAEILRK